MLNIPGLNNFSKYFKNFNDQYVLIGGTACSILYDDVGLDFRATKDLDIVLIVEALTPAFGEKFWQYVNAGQYEKYISNDGTVHFYRFKNPKAQGYPKMIELFSRAPQNFTLPEDDTFTKIPFGEAVSSLSAILLNESYYNFLGNGQKIINEYSVLDAEHIIPFKIKAWLDLSNRSTQGEHVDSNDIKKHKNDVFRLALICIPDSRIKVNTEIMNDINSFISAMKQDNSIDNTLKNLKIKMTKQQILELLQSIYTLS